MQIHSLRYYAPVKDAHFACAKHARLLIQLNENGQSGGSFYPAWRNPSDEEGVVQEPLRRRKWCGHCKRITSEGINYRDALWERNAAQTGIKRAYKLLCKLRSNPN